MTERDEFTVRMKTKNRVVIPGEIRKRLHLDEGDLVTCRVKKVET